MVQRFFQNSGKNHNLKATQEIKIIQAIYEIYKKNMILVKVNLKSRS